MSFEEDFLAHYGKKGMRWGKRTISARKENQAAMIKLAAEKQKNLKSQNSNSKASDSSKKPFIERHKKGIKTAFKVAGAASAAALVARSIHKNKVKNVNAFLLNQHNNPRANPRNVEFAKKVLTTNLKLKQLRDTGQISRTQKAISSKVLLNKTFKTIQRIPKYDL